jgi:two-component system, OmpR family, phosphate regulon response regulator PhoB
LSAGKRPIRILAVDDEPEALALLRELFATGGYAFEEATDAAQAITMVQDDPPDLLIIDYMMPAMSGMELCAYLRSDFDAAGIPIIIYSAYEVPDRYWQKGLFERKFLKPADFGDFLEAVRALVS